MQVVKENKRFEKLDVKAVRLINEFTNAKIEYEKEEKEVVNVCKTLIELREDGVREGFTLGKTEGFKLGKTEGISIGKQSGIVIGAIQVFQSMFVERKEIEKKVIAQFHINKAEFDQAYEEAEKLRKETE